jgi:cytoskeletal protein CcmA (bactofilin family)
MIGYNCRVPFVKGYPGVTFLSLSLEARRRPRGWSLQGWRMQTMQKILRTTLVVTVAILVLATAARSKSAGEVINGPLVVNGGLTVAGPLKVDGWLTIDCSKMPASTTGIAFKGKMNFVSSGDPKAEPPGRREPKVINGDMTVNGPLTVHGPLTVQGQLAVQKSLTVGGLVHYTGCSGGLSQ